MFEYNQSVIVKRVDGSSHSGKIVNQVKTDYYLVAYIDVGVVMGTFHKSRITSFDNATFKVA